MAPLAHAFRPLMLRPALLPASQTTRAFTSTALTRADAKQSAENAKKTAESAASKATQKASEAAQAASSGMEAAKDKIAATVDSVKHEMGKTSDPTTTDIGTKVGTGEVAIGSKEAQELDELIGDTPRREVRKNQEGNFGRGASELVNKAKTGKV